MVFFFVFLFVVVRFCIQLYEEQMKLPQHKLNMDFEDSLPHCKAWKNLWIHSVKLINCIVQAIPLIFYFFFKIQNVVFYVLPSFVFLFFDNQSWIPILTHDFKPDVWNELILLAGGLMISCFMISFQMKHYILMQLTSFILIFRWNHEHLFWKFSFLKNWDVKIFDVFVIITVVLFFIKWIRATNKEIPPNEGFLDDLPSNVDKLEFTILAKRLKETIEKTHSETAICIGITGEWGSGKTSFMYLFEDQTKKNATDKKVKEIKVLKFSPWRSGSKDAIIKDFFDTLADELSQENPFLRWKTQRYADKLLTSVTENKLIHAISGIFHDQSSQKLYDEINETVKNLPYTLVVMIDDLDRMDSAEIMSVLKIIRNAADFGNLFFLLAYDRTKIDQAILEEKIPDAEKFLDKIVNVEISLPAYPENAVKEVFVAEFSKLIKKDETKNELNFLDSHTFELLNFRSLRDVKRFINGYRIHYLKLLNEEKIDLRDSLLIESLRESNPKIFNQLKDFVQFGHNDFELFRVNRKFLDTGTYLNIDTEKKGLKETLYSDSNSLPNRDELQEKLSRELKEIDPNQKLKNFLNLLFQELNPKTNQKSIVWAENTSFYFRFEDRNEFSFVLYLSYLGKSEKEFFYWAGTVKSETLDSYKNTPLGIYKNQNFFVLLGFLKTDCEDEKLKTEKVLAYFIKLLFDCIEAEEPWDINYFKSENNTLKEAFKIAFQDKINSPKLLNISEALRNCHSYENGFFMPFEDMIAQQVQYLEKYLERNTWDKSAMQILYNCLQEKWDQVNHNTHRQNGYKFSEETKEKLKPILSEHLDNFVAYLLENEQDNDVQRFFKNRWYLFENDIEMVKFLNPHRNNSNVLTYLNFVNVNKYFPIDNFISLENLTPDLTPFSQSKTIIYQGQVSDIQGIYNLINDINQNHNRTKPFYLQFISSYSLQNQTKVFEFDIRIDHDGLFIQLRNTNIELRIQILDKGEVISKNNTTFLENVKTYITTELKND